MPKRKPTFTDDDCGLPPVRSIRSHFPALKRRHKGQPVAYFDGPGGTQVPRLVVETMSDYLLHHNANTHWAYPTSQETDAALAEAREVFADFLNASPREVAFGNNMTTLTFHVARALGRKWGPGDEIVVTELDHQANVAPWRRLAQERGVTIRLAPFAADTGELIWKELEELVTSKTRLLAIGAASNALGTVSPVREAARLAHERGALCFVDAVHYAAHRLIDVRELDCDFLVCSPYKFYGPHAGVLYAKAGLLADLDVPKLGPAPNEIPERVETGTQNHEGIVGSAAAVEFLASLTAGRNRRQKLVRAMTGLHEQGERLFRQLWAGLQGIDGLTCFGPAPGLPRTPTVSFALRGFSSEEVAARLAQKGLFVSHGHFYATTVVARLGQEAGGVVRVGCACYTSEDEIERLLMAVGALARKR